jgi:hypothetical protein
MMRSTRVLVLFLCLGAAAFGQPSAASGSATALPAQPREPQAPRILAEEAVPLLGLDLAGAYARFGPPASVSTFRGPEPWQDDVVFSYQGGWSLFWAGDRVWQLRFGEGYAGPVFGLYLGDGADKAWALLGEPYWKDENSLVWRLPWDGYPVRLRAWLKEGRLVDLYLYRADF